MKAAELAIIGAGPAGLAAAAEAASHGAGVVLLDDNGLPGGQYFRQLPTSFRRTSNTAFDKEQSRATSLFGVLQHPNVEHMPDSSVWSMPDEHVLAYAGRNGAGRLTARVILICAGAHDRPVPFPGWTLPGVLTAGGLQNLVKGQRMIPGGKVIVAGNGPLLLVATASLLRGGAVVSCVVEAAPVLRRLPAELWRLAAAPGTLRQAVEYRALMMRHRVPLHTGQVVVEARGDTALREVTIAPIATDGQVERGRARTIDTDTLIVGYGLRPSIELFQIIGCALHHDQLRGGWLPVRSADFETTCPGVFAAGDGAAIGGVEMALVEGRLAGLIVSRRLGRIPAGAAVRRERSLRRQLSRMEWFRVGLERLYAPPASYLDLLTPETVVCRCEDITARELAARRAGGFTSAVALKRVTRIGMGRCQGRNCQTTLAALVARAKGMAVDEVAMPRARPPARPVLIGELLAEDVPEPALPDDPHLPRGERVT